jgi:hypothetical protein
MFDLLSQRKLAKEQKVAGRNGAGVVEKRPKRNAQKRNRNS